MSLPAHAPALELPGFAQQINFDRLIEFALAASPHQFFQARAPPLV
jgi:hypothetical protein